MPLIVENGTGVVHANGYVTVPYVTGYLEDRGRATENGWNELSTAQRAAAILAATDYMENRFRNLYKGSKRFNSLSHAKATWTVPQTPENGETVTIGGRVYTFSTSAGAPNTIAIGASPSATIDHLVAAINGYGDLQGTGYGAGTEPHGFVLAMNFDGHAMVVEASSMGTAGNLITVSSNVTGAAWSSSTLTGGLERGLPQPLSFPRSSLYDRDGTPVLGVPERIKQASAEYAVRALAGPLMPDPDPNNQPGARVVEREEVVGPIKERTRWKEGGGYHFLHQYPAVDAMLAEYLRPSGLVMRV